MICPTLIMQYLETLKESLPCLLDREDIPETHRSYRLGQRTIIDTILKEIADYN
jgi:hypothetical protein